MTANDGEPGMRNAPVAPVRFDHPIEFLSGTRRVKAVEHLRAYFARYTGAWFERFADSDPNRFTANDFTAVSMLGVEVPANTAIWLVNDGAAGVSELLSAVPPSLAIWDAGADLSRDGDMWSLWRHVQGGGWPHHVGGMGTTKTSKLIATKRPHLIPIHDSLVSVALFDEASENYWEPWQAWFTGSEGENLRDLACEVRDESQVGAELAVLRILDIVIWMAQKLG